MLLTSAPSRWRTAALAGLLALSWLPGAGAEEKTQADYFVHELPGAPLPLLKMHAGHIEVDAENNGNLFFWHYENRHIANKQRTVIWLNGGPGCSSMDGALMEVGPYRVKEGGNLVYNNGSWDEFANLLFVDQPVGTGFSYVNTNAYLSELDQMTDHFMIFLEKFFALFPEYEHDDLYIAGESYAGQHIPYIARGILNRNKDASKRPWALKGILIGNGWISPVDQYLAYLPYAYEVGLVQGGTEKAKRIEAMQSKCVQKLSSGSKDRVDTPECESIMIAILQETKDTKADRMHQCVNMYDVRLRDDDSCGMNWPPDLATVTPWLHQANVVEALHINKDKKTGWQECNGAVSSHFRAKNSQPTIEFLPDLMAEIEVVLFSGDQDLICNHLGTEALIDGMTWNGEKGFQTSPGVYAPRRDWTFEGEPAGTYQQARNLTYVVFYNSSHMVPFDYPRRTRDMLDRFMNVDISAIGGDPSDSRIDGEKGPFVSVGGHPNSTKAEQDKTKEMKEAEWKAYYRSGEVALVIVVVVAGLWAFFIWRERRRRAGYGGVEGDEGRESLIMGMGLDNFRRRSERRDLEAADFDERELDDLDGESRKPLNGQEKKRVPQNDSTFSLGGASSEGEGDQYGNVKNPFEEPRVDQFSAQEIATLQNRLNKQLGPEYISQRPGNGGGKVAYLEGNKAIALANEVFGFNGWSSSLGQVQIDYVDESQNGKVSLGLSMVVRITLKGGSYHEDIGYGSIENGKGKAASFEKAKKEAATDGLKRALRTFGNVLGNCLYDKEYLRKVQAMKVKPIRFNEENLYRHTDYALPPKNEEQTAVVKSEPHRTPAKPNGVLRTRTEHLNGPIPGEFDDEFDGNLFDGVELSESHGEEFTVDQSAPKALEAVKQSNMSDGAASNRASPILNGGPPQRPQNQRMQTAPPARGPNGAPQPHPLPNQQHNAPGRPQANLQNARGPQTPVQQVPPRPDVNRPRPAAPPTVDIHAAPKPPQQQQAPPNQPLRTTPPDAQQQTKPNPPTTTTTTTPGPNPAVRAPTGFVTSRAAEMMQNSNADSPSSLSNVAFNPHADSPVPKAQRTPGVDYTRSIPIKRGEVAALAPLAPLNLGGAAAGAGARPGPGPVPGAAQRGGGGNGNGNTNFVNPAQDLNRRIGMPGGPGAGAGAGVGRMSPGPGAPGPRTSAYKVPMKRPPLSDVSNAGAGAGAGDGRGEPEAKKARVGMGGVGVGGVGGENLGPRVAPGGL
ncbi:alpha/beta-hydrolase [Massarina eburnea CBS 473.64]|uniref:Pheromone-processing carboxypeptidase KEX1 n=1 Tax=Massarina eburnea CBS 473.64 TaxID=1395130 RepID=A0A6A6RNA2_9PLEO|nr:alpha/beta-hydrolase [Massarina eburnea CBS 473.64]